MSSPVILQYRRPETLVDGTFVPYGPIIAAQWLSTQALRTEGRTVVDVNSLIEALLPDWHDPMRKFAQHVLLSELIETRGLRLTSTLKRAFLHNRADLIESIRTLVEIGAETNDLPAGSEEEKFFKTLYAAFTAHPESGVPTLRNNFSDWEDPERFAERLARTSVDEKTPPLGRPRALYFHGFYYVHPLQSRLIDASAKLGTPVYHLNAFDPEEPEPYEVWERNPRFGAGPEKRLIDAPLTPARAEPSETARHQLLRFTDVFAMVRHLRSLSGKTRFMAPMSDDVRRLLESFFPRTKERESFLAYPVCRYLWGLYAMWDEEKKALHPADDNIRECLASGWAAGGDDVLRTYERVRDYFEDCGTLDEWRERAGLLRTVITQVMPCLRHPDDAVPENLRRVILTPLATIEAFRVKPEEADELLLALETMMSDAQSLFAAENGRVGLAGHFRKLRDLLERRASEKELLEEEAEILDVFRSRLCRPPKDLTDCPPTHLADAMKFILGGRRESAAESRAVDAPLGGVRPLAEAEAAVLTQKGEELLMCFCDTDALPGKPRAYPWPLTPKFVAAMTVADDARRRLDDHTFFINCTALANRYLLHVAGKHRKLTLSWVTERDGRERAPSFCLERFGDPESARAVDGLIVGKVDDPAFTPPVSPSAIREALERIWPASADLPAEIPMARRACPAGSLMLWYDYALAERPGFSGEFHIRNLLTQVVLVTALEACGRAPLQAAGKIMPLWPAFTYADREQCVAFAKRLLNKTLIEDVDFGAPLRRVHVRYLRPNLTSELYHGAESDPRCDLCPHAALCAARFTGERDDDE